MKKEYIYAGISIFTWGTVSAVSTMLLDDIDTMSVLFYNTSIAFIFLLIICSFTGRLKAVKNIHIFQWLRMMVLGIMGIFGYNLLLYVGFKRLLAQQATTINYLWPILIVVFSSIMFKQKLQVRRWIALLISLMGVVIVAAGGKFNSIAQVDLIGVLACVGAAVCYALYSVLNVSMKCDKCFAMMCYYGISAVCSLIVILLNGTSLCLLDLSELGGMLWLGIVTSGVGYTAWLLALEAGDTAKISNLAYITPFISLFFIRILLNEPISLYSFAGLALIMMGIIIQMVGKKKKDKQTEEIPRSC